MSSPHAYPPRSSLDLWISAADTALRTLGNAHTASRTPTAAASGSSNEASPLSDEERRLSASLMRVNHVGEVCAQALYNAQALATRNAALKEHFEHAAREEADHLAWTHQRLSELNSRTSLLNPLWYAGAFTIGWLAGRVGDGVSLGFVVETERQVEEHLASHMERLPAGDMTSRTIVRQMKDDEARHGAAARQAGALDLPPPVQWAMRAAAKVMTTTAHYV